MAQTRNNLGGIQKPSSVSDFKKKREPVELPSGLRMVLKPTSLSGFLQTGQIPNSLMAVVKSAMADKTGENVDAMAADVMSDPEGLKDLFAAMDTFVISVAVEPRVYPVPNDDEERRDDIVYVDELDDEDKMFIFTRAIGGAGGAEPFRQEPAGRVGAVQPRKAVGGTAKRTPRAK
jgi:hypothetical protein